jgi:hypothetical protein
VAIVTSRSNAPREPHSFSSPADAPLPYTRRERREDRRAAVADALNCIPADPSCTEPTAVVKQRVAGFLEAAAAAFLACLRDEDALRAELTLLTVEVGHVRAEVESVQPAPLTVATDGHRGAIEVWREQRDQRRLASRRAADAENLRVLDSRREERVQALKQRRLRHESLRDRLGTHALRRIHTYEAVLCRRHPYGDELAETLRELSLAAYSRALSQLLDLERQMRDERPLLALVHTTEID